MADRDPRCRVSHEKRGERHIVSIKGEVDIYSASSIEEALGAALDSGTIVVDMRECRYIDSTAISALIRARKKTKKPMYLVIRPGTVVDRIVSAAQIGKIMRVVATLDEALQA